MNNILRIHGKIINLFSNKTTNNKDKYLELVLCLVVFVEFIIIIAYTIQNYSNPDINRIDYFLKELVKKIGKPSNWVIGVFVFIQPLGKAIISMSSYVIKRRYSLRNNGLEKCNILSKTKYCANINIRKVYGPFLVEMLLLPVNCFAITLVAKAFVWFANLRMSSRISLSGTTVIITLLSTILIIQILQKFINDIRMKLIVMIPVECMLVLMLTTFNYTNRQRSILIMAITTIFISFSWICVHRVIGIYNEYNQYVIRIFRSIRYTFLCCYTLKTFFTVKVIDRDWILWGWIVLNLFEYLYVLLYKKREPSEITLQYTNGQCKKARGKVVQYGNDMVMYTLIDNTEEMVHCKEIKDITFKITYEKSMIPICLTKQEKKVVCRYSNSKKEEYSNYHFLNKNWVCFCSICDETKKVKIVKNSDINTITSTKNKFITSDKI